MSRGTFGVFLEEGKDEGEEEEGGGWKGGEGRGEKGKGKGGMREVMS